MDHEEVILFHMFVLITCTSCCVSCLALSCQYRARAHPLFHVCTVFTRGD
jgi:hypothetical protein